MKRSIYKPQHPLLSRAVSCIGQIELTPKDSDDGWFGLLPDGSSNLTISLGDEPVTYFNKSGMSLIYASWSSPAAIKRSGSLKFLNVMFKPNGLHLVSGIPASEYPNLTLNPDCIFPKSEIDLLRESLLECMDNQKRFFLIERFLAKKLNENLFDDRLTATLKLLDKPSMGLDQLCDYACLSPRRFRELFRNQTGYSPMFYKKIMRFNQAARQINSTSLTDIALSNGYYDQSHFIRDFKLFAGITPSEYLRNKSNPGDFYNFHLSDLSDYKQTAI